MHKRIKSIIGLGLMFSLLLFVIACNSDSPQSTFDPHGPIAELQKNLFMFTFWIAVVVFIIVEGGMSITTRTAITCCGWLIIATSHVMAMSQCARLETRRRRG